MKDRIYPAIYESTSGEFYLYVNDSKYYSINRGEWDSAGAFDCDHDNDENITRKYLKNTRGEVRSFEHAKFIIKLAELHGFDCGGFIEGDDVYFYTGENSLDFTSIEEFSCNRSEKEITIPPPPKADKQELSEWGPEVGDEVQTSTGKGWIVVPPDKNGMYIVMIDGCYRAHSIESIKKPKTPEEEFASELIEKYKHLPNHEQAFAIARDVINNAIAKLKKA